MMLATMLVATAISSGPELALNNDRFLAIHRRWQQIHETATNSDRTTGAILVVDPDRGQMRIQIDGRTLKGESQSLPKDLDWVAYHVTVHGIREIPFPVKIHRFRVDVEDSSDDEQIMIFGSSKNYQWHCSVSSTIKGHGFSAGGGTGKFSSLDISLPAKKADTAESHLADSIAIFEPVDHVSWSESVRNKWFSIKVARTSSGPAILNR